MLKAKNATSSSHYVLALLEQAIKKDIDVNTLLFKSDIKLSEIRQSSTRIKTEKIATLVQLMWDALQDENLGLSKYPCKPGSFYMMGKLTIHQPTLGKALALGIRFYNLFIEGYDLALVIKNDQTIFQLNQQDLQMDPDHLLTELILLAWHRYSSWLIGQDIPLHSTSFNYPPPKHMDEYKFLFPSNHCFNQTEVGFSFHCEYLNRPIIQNEKSLKLFMSHCPAALFLRHKWDDSINKKIRLQLEETVQNGFPNFTLVANSLNMTSQTLRRKLKAEGSSYQQIKDLVRRDTALYLLSQPHLTISEITRRIGFSEPSVFVRAFKGWTGITPGAYRHNLNNINSDQDRSTFSLIN